MRLSLFGVSVSLFLSFVVSGCILSDDVDKFSFSLPEKTFQLESASMGIATTTEIQCDPLDDVCPVVDPSLVCDPQKALCALSDTAVFPSISCTAEDVCAEMGGGFFCDERYGACSASAPVQLSASVHLSEEVQEIKEVGNLSFAEVTLESFYFIVEVNTMGMETPDMGIYVANNGVLDLSFNEAGEVITPGVFRIGTLPSVPANFTGRKETVLTGPGQDVLCSYIKEPDVPFKLFVGGIVTVVPGQDLPNPDGQFRVIVSGTAIAETTL